MKYYKLLLSLLALHLLFAGAYAETTLSVSQYGITWTFDKPCTVGKFVTGDWWVIGPVKIVKVDPTPGPAIGGQEGKEIKGRYGVAQFKADGRMRNGSMIFPDLPDKTRGSETGKYSLRKYWLLSKQQVESGIAGDDMPQGFDSRDARFYFPSLSIAFPKELKPGESLCSSISYPEPFQQTYGQEIKLVSDGKSMLQTVAVLTCLDKAPPADAFRPPYAGKAKPIFETKNLKWDLLLNLPSPPTYTDDNKRVLGAVPDWKVMERLVERPCIDRIIGSVNENCNTYGREFARVNGMATLMLMLDVPKAKKEKLLINMVQRGIDYYGLMKSGQVWIPDGGINMGRKWAILFAGLMLGEKDLMELPSSQLWQEDTNSYYGTAWDGTHGALLQITFHTGPTNGLPYEELPVEKRGEREAFASGYAVCNAISWPGEALCALLMKEKALWNHDAFFDAVDRYMRNDSNILYFNHKDNSWSHTPSQGVGHPIGQAYDSFVNAMWKAYRDKVPAQPDGRENKKWVWSDLDMMKGYGEFVPNPKTESQK